MSFYGIGGTVNGLPFGLALRGVVNGSYRVVFEREHARLEEIEKIDWSAPDIQGEGVLPRGYGFQVEAITYSSDQRAYTVHLQVDGQYLGDVTGYQAQIDGLNEAVAQKDAAIGALSTQLAEADELAAALYEELEGTAAGTAAEAAEEVEA